MTLTIKIKNVDDEAYTDINYFINKYFMKIEGVRDTGGRRPFQSY